MGRRGQADARHSGRRLPVTARGCLSLLSRPPPARMPLPSPTCTNVLLASALSPLSLTCTNALASAGSCLCISAALKMVSRYSHCF